MNAAWGVLATIAVVLALGYFWWLLYGRPRRDERRLDEIQAMVDEIGPNPSRADALRLAEAWEAYGDEHYASVMRRVAADLPD